MSGTQSSARAALELLYREHYARLLTVIDHRVSDLHEAEDLTARVFELAWEHLSDGEAVSPAWLYACARNVVGSEYQRRDRMSRSHLHLVSGASESGAEEVLARQDAVARALRGLSAADQDIVKLFYWHEMTTADIAGMVGLSNAAVKMRLSRARAALAEILNASVQGEAFA